PRRATFLPGRGRPSTSDGRTCSRGRPMTTRERFLEGIRREVEKGGALFSASSAPRPARPAEAAELVRRQMAERWPEALDRFRLEFERVAGVFHRVADWDDVADVIVGIAREKMARTAV